MKYIIVSTQLTLSLLSYGMEKNNELTHQSPEITCIHSKEYLNWLTDNRSEQELKAGLAWTKKALDATDRVILTKGTDAVLNIKKNRPELLNYSICTIPDSFYAAGNSVNPQYADPYAIIPIAAAHALKSNLFERILIIEEHIDEDAFGSESREYYRNENGSIFFPKYKNKNSDLFNEKIFIQYNNEIKYFGAFGVDNKRYLRTIYNTNLNDTSIDLAFFNINEDNKDFTQCYQRRRTVASLIKKNIPIVFICASQLNEKQLAQLFCMQIFCLEHLKPSSSWDIFRWLNYHEHPCSNDYNLSMCEGTQKLIKSGIDVNQKNLSEWSSYYRWTPLEMAMMVTQCEKCTNMLRQYGAQETKHTRGWQKRQAIKKERGGINIIAITDKGVLYQYYKKDEVALQKDSKS